MNVKLENVEKNVVQFEIEVDAEKFKEGMQKSYVKNAKRFNIPGFRRGKAPRAIVERYYGEQVLYEDAINFVCPDAYDKAVEENGIYPVDRPEIDIIQIGDGENLIFTAKVTVKPEVELGEYKGVEVERAEADVTDEDVDNELKKIQDKNARLITVEDRGIQTGDSVVIDFEGFIDGIGFDGGKASDYSLVIGSGQFIKGFEEQLIGAKTGDELKVNVTFPEDYNSEELAGKPAVFDVKIKDIKTKELPVLDDEFAKDVSEFDTLEAYKEDLHKRLVESAEHKAKHENEENVVRKVVEGATVDIPHVMVEKQIDNLIFNFEMNLRYQGLDLKKYIELIGTDMETFRGQYSEMAEMDVKTQLVLEKIGEVENITVTDEEMDNEIKKLAEGYKESEEKVKERLNDDNIKYIRSNLTVTKTIDLLVTNAKFIETQKEQQEETQK